MFYKRLEKAIKQDLKSEKDIINYCRKESRKNHSDSKCTDLQCICEYLLYNLENNCTFEEYQEIIFKSIFENKSFKEV